MLTLNIEKPYTYIYILQKTHLDIDVFALIPNLLCIFSKIFPPVWLFQTVRLLFFENFPASMFIPDCTFIPVLRV